MFDEEVAGGADNRSPGRSRLILTECRVIWTAHL
jgi:hypothetical protein